MKDYILVWLSGANSSAKAEVFEEVEENEVLLSLKEHRVCDLPDYILARDAGEKHFKTVSTLSILRNMWEDVA